MKNEIISHLNKYMDTPQDLEDAIQKSIPLKKYPKGTILVKEGQITNECFFIYQGCIRSYYIKDGEEKTTEIYTEEQVVTPSTYGKNNPSEYYIECLEDCTVGIGTPEIEAKMYQEFPELESLNRQLADELSAANQNTFAHFKMSTPQERYLYLEKTRPEILQRVPQYQIASYLGITPESLSRIRKRLAQNK